MSIEQIGLLVAIAVVTLVRAIQQALADAEVKRKAGRGPAPGELDPQEPKPRLVPVAPAPVQRALAPVHTPPPLRQRSTSGMLAPSPERLPPPITSPPARSRFSPAMAIRAELGTVTGLRRAFVLAAVLGPPRSLDPGLLPRRREPMM